MIKWWFEAMTVLKKKWLRTCPQKLQLLHHPQNQVIAICKFPSFGELVSNKQIQQGKVDLFNDLHDYRIHLLLINKNGQKSGHMMIFLTTISVTKIPIPNVVANQGLPVQLAICYFVLIKKVLSKMSPILKCKIWGLSASYLE